MANELIELGNGRKKRMGQEFQYPVARESNVPGTRPDALLPLKWVWWAYKPWIIGYGLLSTISGILSFYHGYKRNNSVGWGLVWGLAGSVFPIVTPVVGLAQGFGKKKSLQGRIGVRMGRRIVRI